MITNLTENITTFWVQFVPVLSIPWNIKFELHVPCIVGIKDQPFTPNHTLSYTIYSIVYRGFALSLKVRELIL